MPEDQTSSAAVTRAPAADQQLLERVHQRHQNGIAEFNAGRLGNSRRLLRSALATLSQVEFIRPEVDDLTAKVWISLSSVDSEVQGLTAGFEDLTQAEAALRDRPAPDIRVALHTQRGYIHVRNGELADGIVELDRAVDLIGFATDDQAHSTLLNRGTAHLFAGNLAQSRADLQRAVVAAGRSGHAADLAMTEHNLGYLEFLAGNLALALRTIGDVLERRADIARPVVLLDQARVLIEAGLHREADEALREAGELFRAERLWKDVGEVELARAECALRFGDVILARHLAGSARDRFRRRRNERWRREAELMLLQADLAAGRPGGRLVAPALRLAAEFRTVGLATKARTAQLIAADALLRANRLDDARSVAAGAGAIKRSDAISIRLHTRLVRARTHLASENRIAARREIRSGIVDLTSYRAQFGSLDLQTASAVHGRQLVALDLQIAVADGRPSAVLAAAERGRALSSRLQSVVAPEDARRAELLADLRRVYEDLRQVESDPGGREEMSRLRRRAAELQNSLRSRSWELQGDGEIASVVPIDVVVGALSAEGSTMACYVEVGGVLHLAAFAPDGTSTLVALGPSESVAEGGRRARADLDMLADGRLPDMIRGAIATSLARRLRELDEMLVHPSLTGGGELVVIPTGPLATLPWGVLPSLSGRPVTVAPSSTAWFAARSRPDHDGAMSVAVFAGPDLAHAEAEAVAVQDRWSAVRTYRGEAATQEHFVAAMRSAPIVHVAAHGSHHAENPLFSSLRLADGPVFAYELDHSSRMPAHVVLSACELGQATVRPGDEALGLTSVLLHLGTRSVVSSVARVADDVSADVMGRYHHGLASGLDSSRALAEAIASTDPQRPPAPFVCFGSAWSATR